MSDAVLEPSLNEEFFNEVLESNKDAVRRAVQDALLAGVKRQFEWELPAAVKATVEKFILDEVVPAIHADLAANKEALVTAATEMVRGVPAEIGKAMQEKLAANLTNSWTMRKIVEAAFQ
jgi:hypothetical protein